MTREHWVWLVALTAGVAFWLGWVSSKQPEFAAEPSSAPHAEMTRAQPNVLPATIPSVASGPRRARPEAETRSSRDAGILLSDEAAGTYVLDRTRYQAAAVGERLEIALGDGRTLTLAVHGVTENLVLALSPAEDLYTGMSGTSSWRNVVEDLYTGMSGTSSCSNVVEPPISGVVQSVDNDRGVYFLSVGREDAVEAGTEFTVYRGDQYVHTVIVDQVREKACRAKAKTGMQKRPVRVGDKFSNNL